MRNRRGYEACGSFRRVPRAEVLDDRLRVDARLRVARELAHRRRAPEALRGCSQLLEDVLVRVAPAQAGAKGGELRLVDAHLRALPGARASHACNKLRAFWQICKCSRARLPPPRSLPSPPMGLRLGLEMLAARAVGAVSRAAGRGGGTTLPGKLLWKLDPGAVDALAARLPPASRSSRRRTARRRQRRWPRGSSAAITGSPGIVPARTSSRGSRRPSSWPSDAELGLLRGGRGRPSGGDRSGHGRGRLCSRISSATSSTATASSRSSPSAGARAVDRPSRRDDARRQCATTRSRATSPKGATARSGSASTTRGTRDRRCSTPRTRSTAYAAARRTCTRPRTSDISATIAARRAGTRGRRSTSAARDIELRRAARLALPARRAGRADVGRARAARALQRLQRRCCGVRARLRAGQHARAAIASRARASSARRSVGSSGSRRAGRGSSCS